MVIYDEGDSFFPYYKLIAENDHKNIFFELSGDLNKNAITFDNKLISLQTNVLKLIKI
jgi:hypothetical protein